MRTVLVLAGLLAAALAGATTAPTPAAAPGEREWSVTVAGRSIPATRHRLSTPELRIDLWYADGRWVGLAAPTPGGRILRYVLL